MTFSRLSLSDDDDRRSRSVVHDTSEIRDRREEGCKDALQRKEQEEEGVLSPRSSARPLIFPRIFAASAVECNSLFLRSCACAVCMKRDLPPLRFFPGSGGAACEDYFPGKFGVGGAFALLFAPSSSSSLPLLCVATAWRRRPRRSVAEAD